MVLGPRGDGASITRRIAVAIALIVALILVGALAAALLAHPSSSASALALRTAG